VRPRSVGLAIGNHGERAFRIDAYLTELGTYRMVLGPDIYDLFGNRMDQDSDGIQEEATQDQYSFSLTTRLYFPLGSLGATDGGRRPDGAVRRPGPLVTGSTTARRQGGPQGRPLSINIPGGQGPAPAFFSRAGRPSIFS